MNLGCIADFTFIIQSYDDDDDDDDDAIMVQGGNDVNRQRTKRGNPNVQGKLR